VPSFAILVQTDVSKCISMSQTKPRIKFEFLQQFSLFYNRIPDIVLSGYVLIRFGRHFWDTCLESGKSLKTMSVLVQVIREQEKSSWSSQHLMTILVCPVNF